VFKIHEGRPNVLDRIKNGDITSSSIRQWQNPREHEVAIRNAALAAKIPIMTTVALRWRARMNSITTKNEKFRSAACRNTT